MVPLKKNVDDSQFEIFRIFFPEMAYFEFWTITFGIVVLDPFLPSSWKKEKDFNSTTGLFLRREPPAQRIRSPFPNGGLDSGPTIDRRRNPWVEE